MCNGSDILSLHMSLDASLVVLVSHISLCMEAVEDSNRFSIGRVGPSTLVNARQSLVLATPSPDVSSYTALRSRSPPVEMLRGTTSGALTSSTVRCFPLPPPPADSTGQGGTHTILHGTITALKIVQQIIGLDPVPSLKSLVVVVLSISETLNVSLEATFMRNY